MNSITRRQTRQSDRKAALTVEFSLVAPIIFLIFVGSLELTSMNLVRQSAGNAAYEVARSAIVPGSVEAEDIAIGRNILAAVGATNNVDININDNGQTVVVEVVVPVRENSWGLGRFTGDLTIRKSCSLSREL